MTPPQTLENIEAGTLLDKVRVLRAQGFRLVQICATALPGQLELTYSFDLEGRLASLRLHAPAAEPRVPSISSIYPAAFLYENEMHDLFNLTVDDMAVDFHGTLYRTSVKFAFGATQAPAAPKKPATQPAG